MFSSNDIALPSHSPPIRLRRRAASAPVSGKHHPFSKPSIAHTLEASPQVIQQTEGVAPDISISGTSRRFPISSSITSVERPASAVASRSSPELSLSGPTNHLRARAASAPMFPSLSPYTIRTPTIKLQGTIHQIDSTAVSSNSSGIPRYSTLSSSPPRSPTGRPASIISSTNGRRSSLHSIPAFSTNAHFQFPEKDTFVQECIASTTGGPSVITQVIHQTECDTISESASASHLHSFPNSPSTPLIVAASATSSKGASASFADGTHTAALGLAQVFNLHTTLSSLSHERQSAKTATSESTSTPNFHASLTSLSPPSPPIQQSSIVESNRYDHASRLHEIPIPNRGFVPTLSSHPSRTLTSTSSIDTHQYLFLSRPYIESSTSHKSRSRRCGSESPDLHLPPHATSSENGRRAVIFRHQRTTSQALSSGMVEKPDIETGTFDCSIEQCKSPSQKQTILATKTSCPSTQSSTTKSYYTVLSRTSSRDHRSAQTGWSAHWAPSQGLQSLDIVRSAPSSSGESSEYSHRLPPKTPVYRNVITSPHLSNIVDIAVEKYESASVAHDFLPEVSQFFPPL